MGRLSIVLMATWTWTRLWPSMLWSTLPSSTASRKLSTTSTAILLQTGDPHLLILGALPIPTVDLRTILWEAPTPMGDQLMLPGEAPGLTVDPASIPRPNA